MRPALLLLGPRCPVLTTCRAANTPHSELVYGEAPFFAEQIGDTYFRIINFEVRADLASALRLLDLSG